MIPTWPKAPRWESGPPQRLPSALPGIPGGPCQGREGVPHGWRRHGGENPDLGCPSQPGDHEHRCQHLEDAALTSSTDLRRWRGRRPPARPAVPCRAAHRCLPEALQWGSGAVARAAFQRGPIPCRVSSRRERHSPSAPCRAAPVRCPGLPTFWFVDRHAPDVMQLACARRTSSSTRR